jgi:hypothetical protein
MHPIATRETFHQLSEKQQEGIEQVLFACRLNGLSCRCEMVGGRDFTVVIAPGLSSPQWWIDRFDID